MVTEDEETCSNCYWYRASHAGTHGYCRVNPPVFTNLDDRGHPRFFNPVVSPHNFCSLWEEAD